MPRGRSRYRVERRRGTWCRLCGSGAQYVVVDADTDTEMCGIAFDRKEDAAEMLRILRIGFGAGVDARTEWAKESAK